MANDFSADSNCLAVYNFEDGALTTDSKGSNTLIAVSDPAYVSDTTSVELDGNDGFYIPNVDLPSDWPFKGGTTNRIMSVTFWIRLSVIPGAGNYDDIVAKCQFADASFNLRAVNSKYNVNTIGTSTEQWDVCDMNVQDRLYHIGTTLNGSTGDCLVRFYDSVADTATTYTHTFTNTPVTPEHAGFTIGYEYWVNENTNFMTGRLGELVIFKDILTVSEIDSIRQGIYGASSSIKTIRGLPIASCKLVHGLAKANMKTWGGLA